MQPRLGVGPGLFGAADTWIADTAGLRGTWSGLSKPTGTRRRTMFSLALRLGPRPKPDTADCTPRAHEVRELGKQGPVVGPVSTGCGPARTARASHDLVQDRQLRAYPAWARASRAAWAFLKAIRPLASWSRARWFSSFFDQRIRIARLRLSHEWQASTTQRRARQPGRLALRSISSPRLRMCGVSPYSSTSSRESALS